MQPADMTVAIDAAEQTRAAARSAAGAHAVCMHSVGLFLTGLTGEGRRKTS